MITSATTNVGSALQPLTSGSGGVSLELVLLLGIAAAVVVTLVYLFVQSNRSGTS